MNYYQAYPVFIVLCTAVGGLLAHGSDVAIMAGVAAGLAVGVLPVMALGAIVGLMLLWCPERPDCVCGKCNSGEYDYTGPAQKTKGNVYNYKCPHCGREYRSKGPKFEFKTAHGYTPYMEKSRWQRWKKSAR